MTPGYDGFNVYTVNMDEIKFYDYVKNCIEETPYNTVSTKVEYNQKLITLSTCSYHATYGRYVVIARLIDEQTIDLTKPPIAVINTSETEE